MIILAQDSSIITLGLPKDFLQKSSALPAYNPNECYK